MELRRDSVVMEKEFEGSREVFFFVSTIHPRANRRERADGRNALLQLVRASLRLCDLFLELISTMQELPLSDYKRR
jgi:hypothetical protein